MCCAGSQLGFTARSVCSANPTRAHLWPSSSTASKHCQNNLVQPSLRQSLIHHCTISSGFWLRETSGQNFINTHSVLGACRPAAAQCDGSLQRRGCTSDCLLSVLPGSLLKSTGHVLWPDHQGCFSLLLGSCKNESQLLKISLFSIWQGSSGVRVFVCACVSRQDESRLD